ncbi:hypothetical protein AADZ91_16380 [Colwelliaceae bacterium 6441]
MKINNVRSYISTSLLALSAVCFSQGVLAEKCSTIQFSPEQVNGKVNVVEVIGNNGTQIVKPKAYKKVASGKQKYYLEPGLHTLTLNQWVKKEYISNIKYLRRGRVVANPPVPIQKTLLIDIKVNQQYELGFKQVNGQSIINILKSHTESCDNDELLAAQGHKEKSFESNLPNQLEQKLRITMNKVAAYQKESTNNFFPHQVSAYFGTVLSKSYEQNGKALSVSTVIPYSLANELSLRSGDLIVALGKKPIANAEKLPSVVFNEYLAKIPYGKKVEIGVLREGNRIDLGGLYLPVILPGSHYEIGDVNNDQQAISQMNLPQKLKFEYDQLLLAISHSYNNSKQSQQIIVLTRKEDDNNVGFKLSIDLSSIGIAKQNIEKYHKLKKGEAGWEENSHNKRRVAGYDTLGT